MIQDCRENSVAIGSGSKAHGGNWPGQRPSPAWSGHGELVVLSLSSLRASWAAGRAGLTEGPLGKRGWEPAVLGWPQPVEKGFSTPDAVWKAVSACDSCSLEGGEDRAGLTL